MKLSDRKHFLYHIFEDGGEGIYSSGYIGVTSRPELRWLEHQKTASDGGGYNVHQRMREVPMYYKIIDEGTEEYIYNREYKLRPRKNMGLNIMFGGVISSKRKPSRSVMLWLRETIWNTLPPKYKNNWVVKYLLNKQVYWRPCTVSRKKSKHYGKVYAASKTRLNRYFTFQKVKTGVLKITRKW